jgi:hypothetical protein
MKMDHDDLHGLRRQRDPNTPPPWSEPPPDRWDYLIWGAISVVVIIVAIVVILA